eukprot:1085966-Prymnesium_polylepis.1
MARACVCVQRWRAWGLERAPSRNVILGGVPPHPGAEGTAVAVIPRGLAHIVSRAPVRAGMICC